MGLPLQHFCYLLPLFAITILFFVLLRVLYHFPFAPKFEFAERLFDPRKLGNCRHRFMYFGFQIQTMAIVWITSMVFYNSEPIEKGELFTLVQDPLIRIPQEQVQLFITLLTAATFSGFFRLGTAFLEWPLLRYYCSRPMLVLKRALRSAADSFVIVTLGKEQLKNMEKYDKAEQNGSLTFSQTHRELEYLVLAVWAFFILLADVNDLTKDIDAANLDVARWTNYKTRQQPLLGESRSKTARCRCFHGICKYWTLGNAPTALQLVMAIMSGNQMALLGCFWQFQGMGDLGGGAD